MLGEVVHCLSDRAGAAPKVSEFPVTVQIDCVPDDVVMDMGLVDMGADHKGVIALGEPLCKLHAQPVGFFRGGQRTAGHGRPAHRPRRVPVRW